ncbi:MAG TPA: regulatory protein RecX [Albitalea sp.]|nr:regulatory protein RecX [Albitalea sp.]
MATKRPPLSLKGRALAMLAQREHSATELRRKLLRHAKLESAAALAARASPVGGEAPSDSPPSPSDAAARVDEVIAWLRDHRYLSEERFIESRVHARASRYGNLRIRQELAQHGLSLPADAAQTLKDSELERATEVWQRKFGQAPADAAGRARQARFLAQRGFSPEVIARVLRQAGRARGGFSRGDPEAD